MKLDLYCIPLTKTNPKWMKDLNIRSNTIKLQGKNIGKKLLDNGLSNAFFNIELAQAAKAKISGTTSNKKASAQQETINKNGKVTYKWEKRLANHVSDKGLTAKIRKELT